MSSGKTNKSFTKRLKVTKSGTVLSRKSGQNHFNAKESRNKRLKKKGTIETSLSARKIKRFIPHN